MGYTNRDKRLVTVGRKEKRTVRVLRRRAEKRELRGEPMGRTATRATRRGWWYA
jgi:hypothetical protein